ncbi:MAG: hypothetical protein QOH79_3272 [Acidimicrobiaceae bacterium]
MSSTLREATPDTVGVEPRADEGGLTPTPPGIGRAAVRGVLWSYAAFVGSKLALFASTVVLARLLAPDDFGVMSLSLAIMTYVDALNDFGIGQAIIYLDRDDETTASTAFVMTMATGIAAAAVVAFSAAPMARLFNEPDLVPIMRILALSYVLVSLSAVHSARLRRMMNFRRRVVPELAKSAVKAVVSVGFAAAGFGVWSLVWGQLAGVAVSTIVYWKALPWRPRWNFDRDTARQILTYGGGMMLVTFLAVVARDVDYLIVGQRLGAAELGRYTLGFRLPDLVLMGVTYAVSEAFFPALSRLRAGGTALRSTYLRAVSALALVTAPLGVGIAVIAQDFVHVAYGERWATTAPVLSLISLYFIAQSIVFVAGDVYKALGRQRILWIITAARLVVTVVVLLLVADRGIVAVAAAQTALVGAGCVVQLAIAARLIGAGVRPLLNALRPAAVGVAVLVPAAMGTHALLEGAAPALRLTLVTLAGGAAYLVTVYFSGRVIVDELRATLRRRPVVV